MSKNDQTPKTLYPGDEIDLNGLFGILRSGKKIVFACSGLGALIALIIAVSLPNIYTASALLAPAESDSNSFSSLARQYGGLASLAGISLPGGEEGDRKRLGMQLMKSRAFIGDFVERHDILPELMAVESWNESTGEIVFNSDDYDAENKKWVRDVDFPKKSKPSLLEAHEEFMDIFHISEDKETGYVIVAVAHQSPVVASQWVSWLVEDVNSAVKSQHVAEAVKSIEYLKLQASSTPLADLQAVFFELIQSQTEIVMLAEVRPEYVFKTVDPAVAPEEKSQPARALICILGAMLGLIIGVLTAVARHPAH